MGTILVTISLILQLVVPMLLEVFTDGLQTFSTNSDELIQIALWMVIVGIGVFAFRSTGRIYIFRLSRLLERNIRERLFSHWETLQTEYYQKQRIGNLMAHAVNDVNVLRQIGMQGVFQTLEAAVLITVTVIMMATTIDLYLTLLVLLPLPGLTYLAYRFRIKIRMHSNLVQEAIGSLTSRVQEYCSGIRIIKTYVQEKSELKKFEQDNQTNVEANQQLIRSNSLFNSLSQGIVGLSYLTSIVFGSILVMQNTISLGEFVAFNTYLSLLVGPIENLGKVINLLQQGSAADLRLRDVLSTKPSIKDEDGIVNIPSIQGDITIKGLSFSYQNKQGHALSSIDLHIPKGTTLAIVGKIGSGKSTLVNLLLRIYNPPRKTIYIDHTDIRDIPLKMLRRSIGFVPQDHFLFSTSIKENIGFDPKGYKDHQVGLAAKQAHVYHDIKELPQGFETTLGERGLSLSGGQRQRVSIARALVKEAPIMIFDDSLSAVDSKTEKNILHTLKTKMKETTTILISHRISTIQHADQIIVLDQGKIIERGTHQTLLKNNGVYKKMHNQQLTGLNVHPADSNGKPIAIKRRNR
ncbi:ABC transporter ATP-binding protein [Fredinandcohnia onubensis]|uniref:ABC transporter ATP-binding protein n=1 Tax=Fredinandcohnia onubensis TaxID=1571209 RepID=UPI0015D513A7|nr:ABC transporter ATP-binding protein [Fredinandcohnia onubensis]